MTPVIVTTGREMTIRGAVDWLEAKGIPAALVRGIALDAVVGEPITLTVQLYVDEIPEPGPGSEPEPGPHPEVHPDE